MENLKMELRLSTQCKSWRCLWLEAEVTKAVTDYTGREKSVVCVCWCGNMW